ncbi:MAG TPA: HEAT repeat domain-containing protein [Verrucomicrobiae bacterium]|nr:HEAT repeat domain-containing protein [Verrucomicrobiae bacterium]
MTVRGQSFQRIPPTPTSLATIPTLLTELDDPSPLVRESAAVELGELGVDAFDALPDLKRLARDDPDEEVRRASKTALFNVRGGYQSWLF